MIPVERSSYPSDEQGHGATQHPGLFSHGDSAALPPGLRQALERLLQLGAAQAHSRVTVVNPVRLHHLDSGSGPCILLLHGGTGGSANWYRLIGPLAREFRVLALDLPGFGVSDPIEPIPPLGERLARLLTRWLDTLAIEQLAILATSFGGLAALRLAQQQPERVTALALLDAAGLGRELPRALRLACLRPVAPFALRPSRGGIHWQFRHLMVGNEAHLPREHVPALLEYLWQSSALADRVQLARAFTLFAGLHGQREVLTDHELRALRVPTLVLWGEQDRFLPCEHGRRAAALVPNAQFRIIPAVGHSPNWEAPDAVLAALSSFLHETSLG